MYVGLTFNDHPPTGIQHLLKGTSEAVSFHCLGFPSSPPHHALSTLPPLSFMSAPNCRPTTPHYLANTHHVSSVVLADIGVGATFLC